MCPWESSVPQGTSARQMGKAVYGRCSDQNADATAAVPTGETLLLAYESGAKRGELAATPLVPQSVSKSEEAT